MRLQRTKARISEIRRETPDVKLVMLDAGKDFSFIPGQFILIFFEDSEGKFTRAYSIASSPNEKRFIELCIKLEKEGRASKLIEGWKENDILDIQGPAGRFNLKAESDEIVFIAAGAGIAPLMSMIRKLMEDKKERKVSLVFGFRKEEDFIYRDELEKYAKNDNFELVTIISSVERTEEGKRKYVQHSLEEHTKYPENKEFYVCGLKEMVDSTRKQLEELDVPKNRIFFEKF